MSAEVSKTVRAWAWFDLLVNGLLVLPVIAVPFLMLLNTSNQTLGLSGIALELSATHLLFCSLTGSLGVVWALGRLVTSDWRLGWIDTVARGWVALVIIGYLVVGNMPLIFALFVVTELAGTVHQAVIYRRANLPLKSIIQSA